MKIRYSEEEFNSTKIKNKLKLECYQCGNIFLCRKQFIIECLKGAVYRVGKNRFCSKTCTKKSRELIKIVECKNCNISFRKRNGEVNRHPNNFCSSSCAATFNNKNKKHGTRRSKLESWIEKQMKISNPNNNVEYNMKTIGSELDIYLPEINLAFEINGIFHYKPIYGEEKLKQISKNDEEKKELCKIKNISLIVIDISNIKRYNDTLYHSIFELINKYISNKYLDDLSYVRHVV